MKKILLISILLTPGVVFGKTISGTVVDESDVPVPGVVVMPAQTSPNSQNSAQTQDDGTFTISNFPESEQMCAESMGYERTCVSSAATKITLKVDSLALDNAIVVADVDCNDQLDKLHAIKARKTQNKTCVPTKCKDYYEFNSDKTKCEFIDGKDCFSTDKHETYGKWKCQTDTNGNNTSCFCAHKTCENSYKLNSSNNSCEKITIDCAKFLNKLNATAAKQKTTVFPNQSTPEVNLYQYCYPTKCDTASGYDINGSGEDATCVKVAGTDCTSQITGASTATLEYDAQKKQIICKVSECNENLYFKEPQDNKCQSKDGKECNNTDNYAERAEYECVENKCTCKIQRCTKGYTPSTDGKSCVEKNCECGKIWDKNKRQCIDDPRKNTDCPNTNKGIESGKYQCVDDEMTCIVTNCSDGYKPDGFLGNGDTLPTKCVSKQGDICTEQFNSTENLEEAKYKKVNNKLQCVITRCKDNYTPSDDGKTCEQTEGDCPAYSLPDHASAGKLHKGICKATDCDPGYMVESGECVELSGTCKPDDPNAKSGHLKYDKDSNQEICIIDTCKKYYKPSDDGQSCVLANEHSAEELKEKSENVNKLRDREQSLANRMTSAVSMGATGIGGMMVAEALSEKKSDADAEQDMAAYLATFRCEYAGGKTVLGGTNGVQLPADKLFDLYQEYVTLANEVKDAKSQLGLKPGIESEVVLDKANIGLYDDTSTGKTNGTYASVARALSDPTSVDAQKWNEQKAQTDKNMQIGAGLAIGGVAVGVIGNIIDEVTFEEDEMFEDAVFDTDSGDCIENCPKGQNLNIFDMAARSSINAEQLAKKLKERKGQTN